MKRRPQWPLDRVKALAAAPGGLFVQVTRARRFFPTLTEAKEAARAAVLSLTEEDFAETVALVYDTADVYGVTREGAGWYLKLTIDEAVPEVAVISFHPLERPLRTNRGVLEP